MAGQAWERLEKAEHERELALRNELIRQEKLEMIAARFDRKAAMRETWLSENQRLVSQVTDRHGERRRRRRRMVSVPLAITARIISDGDGVLLIEWTALCTRRCPEDELF